MKAANDNCNDELIGRTREVWQPRFGRDLSRDEAKQIAASLTGFFVVLAEWSRTDMLDPVSDSDGGRASGAKGACNER